MKERAKIFLHGTRQAVVVTVVLMLICGLLFPLLLTGLSALIFPNQANGNLITVNGQTLGAKYVGQEFTEDYYMWSRPSAYHYNVYTEGEDGKQYYPDGTEFPGIGSGSNNYAPSNPALAARVEADIANYVARNLGVDVSTLPGDEELLAAQIAYIAALAGMPADQLTEQAADLPEESDQVLGYLAETAGLALDDKELEEVAEKAPSLYQMKKEYIAEAANTTLDEVERIISTLPTDLLTASGSGLDPHISPASAEIQIPRIVEASNLSEDTIREIIARHTTGKMLGVFGETTVNVLEVNIEIAQAMGNIPS